MGKQKHVAGGARKKTYSKPEIREVKLRPEEAVLGNCKNSVGTGPTYAGCAQGAVSCTTLAS